MSAFCQVSLARQQSINCLQLAEFPPLSCSHGQSGARSVEQRRLAVATAPLALVYTLHTLLAAVVRLLKLHAKVKQNLPLLLSRMSWLLTKLSPFGMFWFLFPGMNLPSAKREMGSQYQTPGAEVISEVEGANEQDVRAELCVRWCPVPPADACGFQWWYLSSKTDVGEYSSRTGVGGAACLNVARAKDKPRLFG